MQKTVGNLVILPGPIVLTSTQMIVAYLCPALTDGYGRATVGHAMDEERVMSYTHTTAVRDLDRLRAL